jgi:hypothetical protein
VQIVAGRRDTVVPPANQAEANAQAATMQQLTIIHAARQRRIGVNHDGITCFEWLILIAGGACIVCFCWLFGLRSERIHLLMTSTVVTIIASVKWRPGRPPT